MDYDLCVIGGGPGGNYAAYRAASQGLKVVLVEEHHAIGEPLHCGECLSALAFQRLSLKPEDSFIERNVKGIDIIMPGDVRFRTRENGYVLDKVSFERHLAELAKTQGATYRLGERALSFSSDAGLAIVKTSLGEVRAKVVVDASGVSGFGIKHFLPNEKVIYATGLQYRVDDIETTDFLEFFILPRYAPHGYLWIIPKKERSANIGLIAHTDGKAKQLLEEFMINYRLADKPRSRIFGGLEPASGPVSKTYFNRMLLIGDAAGFTSPLFEGGTHLAMMSAKLAVEVVLKALERNDFSEKTLAEYQQMWKKEFPSYETLLKGKETLYSFTDEELKRIGLLMPKDYETISLIDKIRIGLRLITFDNDLLRKGVMEVFNSFAHSRADHYGW